jgi:hypothetical protein
MKIAEAADIYDFSMSNLHVQISQGCIPESALVRRGKANRVAYIDHTYLVRRKEFEKKIWLESHDHFYWLNRTLSIALIAEMLAMVTDRSKETWTSFMSGTLFRLPSDSILSSRIYAMAWEFYRITRAIINRIFRILKVPKDKRDLNIALDML